MGVALELGSTGTATSSDLWHAHEKAFVDVSGGALNETFLAVIGEGIQSFDVTALNPATVAQAKYFAQKAEVSPDGPIMLCYGYLRESYFARPVSGEQYGRGLGTLSDQRMFALSLLFAGESDAFTRHISLYPNIFDSEYYTGI